MSMYNSLDFESISRTTVIACTATFGLAIAGLIRSYSKTKNAQGLPLPPGPRPLPFIGNALDIKPDEPWTSYTQWGAKYGDLVYSRVLSLDIIVINSEDVAKELLDKRSHNYSDRPLWPVNQLFGLSLISALLPYGDVWRLHRRILHQAFRPAIAASYVPIQVRKSRELLLNLYDSPEHYEEHVKSFPASIIMSIVYGYEAAQCNDPLVAIVDKAAEAVTQIVSPGRAAVLASFPVLMRLPTWVPNMLYKNAVTTSRQRMTEMQDIPFNYTREQMAAGTAVNGAVYDALSKLGGENRSEVGTADDSEAMTEAIKGAAATAFLAGAETTTSTLFNFILAMILYPDVQRRAQREIDSVCGTNRLPVLEDKDSLPFIEAIVRETLRWHPVLPLEEAKVTDIQYADYWMRLGLAHATTNDDVYQGYFIPKGTTIIANTWAMSRDETKYPNASDFVPERWLTADGGLIDDIPDFVFGFGRRFCVGKPLAEASLWLGVASLLAVFSFCKPDSGEEYEPKWTFGAASRPFPFPCRVTPRSADLSREKLVQLVHADA
ncbi:cytochrome P450 [Hygrophoropsis aurantiaca]|uniref:Cytochrome P450 n=1 Tax=Hygrophoropsis aurantiaca TaxID=72124 RepID=A0ACB8A5X8_9AGAM|nr:cytochrome P450 [Hygrophoropsis aurantiaca]